MRRFFVSSKELTDASILAFVDHVLTAIDVMIDPAAHPPIALDEGKMTI